MVEEELGLSLETHEHPIKQSLGAAFGAVIATIFCGAGLFIFHTWGIFFAALFVIGAPAGLSSRYEQNRMTPAIIWNVGIAIFAFGTVYYLTEFFIN